MSQRNLFIRFITLIDKFTRTTSKPTARHSLLTLLAAALIPTLPNLDAQTAGAPMPFVDFNAATSSGVQTNGRTLGSGLYFGQLAMEAEGRKATILIGQGQYVSFTLTAPANAVTIHYAIPDAPRGTDLQNL